MATDPELQPNVSTWRLWFGFVATAIAWTLTGCVDIVIAWRFCQHQRDFGVPADSPAAPWLAGLLAVALLIISVISGIISYRNWQRLAPPQSFIDSQAVERHEFLAVLGVIITITLGMGIVWFALPSIIVNFCWRAK